MMSSSEITFSIDKSTVPTAFGEKTFQALIVSALENWGAVCGVVFREVEKPALRSHITFLFIAQSGSDSNYMDAYAATTRNEETGSRTIAFDKNQAWNNPVGGDGELQGIDLYSVILHEIGHAIGIKHEDVKHDVDVMHAEYVGRKTKLTFRDIDAALKYNRPRLDQFAFAQPGAVLVPLGDYVYLIAKKDEKRDDGHIGWTVLRSRSLRVWAHFEDFETGHDGRIFANRFGHDKLVIGLLTNAASPELHVETRPLQWQVPMVFPPAERPANGTVISKKPSATAPTNAAPSSLYTNRVGLLDGPINYCGQSVWATADRNGLHYHSASMSMSKADIEKKSPGNAPGNFAPTHLTVGRIRDESLFIFWREANADSGRPAIRFTRDATPGRFVPDEKAGLVGTVPGAHPDGDFGEIAVNDHFFISFLVKNMLHTVVLKYDRTKKTRLKAVPEMNMKTQLHPTAVAMGSETLVRSFYHQGRLFTALTNKETLHFVEH